VKVFAEMLLCRRFLVRTKGTRWMEMDMEHWWNGFSETILKDSARTAQ